MLIAALVVLGMIGLLILGFIIYGMFLGISRLTRASVQAYKQIMTPGDSLYENLQTGTAQAPTSDKSINATPVVNCWDVMQCPVDVREACPAYRNRDLPCWLALMQADKYNRIKSDCLGCKLFSLPKSIEQ